MQSTLGENGLMLSPFKSSSEHEISTIPANKLLQVAFDPPPALAAAKADVASNAPELRRYVSSINNLDFLNIQRNLNGKL